MKPGVCRFLGGGRKKAVVDVVDGFDVDGVGGLFVAFVAVFEP